MKKQLKNLKNSKYFPIVIVGFTLFIIIVLLVIKSLITGVTIDKYGNRLKGINGVPFKTNEEKKVITSISSNEKTSNVKVVIKGKIINILFTVSDDVSIDDAKKIADGALSSISGNVKKFYDIQVFISKPTEKGTTQDVQTSDGKTKTEVIKDFPLVGYKNSNRDGFVW